MILLWPGKTTGRGIEVASDLSVNDLEINWQKTILTTISEHLPTGVLTGSELTDIRFTLISGKAHLKHTDSQDFREAVRRAVRQGLMKTESVLLEPMYDFVISLPTECVGRAMTDISDMDGICVLDVDGTLKGSAPARCISDYQTKLTQYTSGQGTIELKFAGYTDMPEEVMAKIIEEKAYDPDSDKNNPAGSIFCAHGAGYYVPWFECEDLMHLPSRESEYLDIDEESDDERLAREAEQLRLARQRADKASSEEGLKALGTDEIDDILRSATHSNAGKENRRTKRVYLSKSTVKAETRSAALKQRTLKTFTEKPKYLLVDGYNIIHAWQELRSLLEDEGSNKDRQSLSLESARFKLLDIMSEYKAMKGTEVIVVFDAYNVKGHITEKMDYMGVHVVYTKEAETADQYIARFTMENSKNLDITVSTSDGLIQLIIRGENSKMLSARELEADYKTLRGSLGI
ncbi:MAG: TetM/TetW/TetO/TetS family tetracycline resistance ribosomal protection protein [Eubacterium sp.]|nr:TetM/TetW/TetO/TetS family tetracycline resistance ribosomal protection protein [Eubacterium sp.]